MIVQTDWDSLELYSNSSFKWCIYITFCISFNFLRIQKISIFWTFNIYSWIPIVCDEAKKLQYFRLNSILLS